MVNYMHNQSKLLPQKLRVDGYTFKIYSVSDMSQIFSGLEVEYVCEEIEYPYTVRYQSEYMRGANTGWFERDLSTRIHNSLLADNVKPLVEPAGPALSIVPSKEAIQINMNSDLVAVVTNINADKVQWKKIENAILGIE